MGTLLGKIEDFASLGMGCIGCATLSALFLVGVIAFAVVYGVRRDRLPPSD